MGLTDAQNELLARALFAERPGSRALSAALGGTAADGAEPTVAVAEYFVRLATHANTPFEGRPDLQQLALWLRSVSVQHGSLAALFEEWDSDGDGYLSYEEFTERCNSAQDAQLLSPVAALQQQRQQQPQDPIQPPYEQAQFEELARAVDFTKAGQISFLEFVSLFTQDVGGRADGRLGASLVEHLQWTLWSNDVVYHKAMRVYDPDATGTLEREQFVAALDAMNEALGSPLQHTQLADLAASLPTTGKGRIDYEGFLAAFRVRAHTRDSAAPAPIIMPFVLALAIALRCSQVHDTRFGATTAAPAPSDPIVEA
eukprot:4347449-Prymnesium_polylepis.2